LLPHHDRRPRSRPLQNRITSDSRLQADFFNEIRA
jgi:hypothetical protein